MLINISNPRINEQFHATWQALDVSTRKKLEKKIAFITDNDLKSRQQFPNLIPQKKIGGSFRLSSTNYYKWAELYTVVLYEQALVLTDAGLRGAIACELASVLQEGRRWILEVDEALAEGGDVDPWIPEILGECLSLDDFWEWLEDTVQFEAESTVKQWGLEAVIPDHALTKKARAVETAAGEEGRAIPVKHGLELLFNRYEVPAIL